MLLIAAFAVSTIEGVRSQPGFSPLYDGWIQGGAYVAFAVLAVLRPLTNPRHREVWGWLAAAWRRPACWWRSRARP